METSSSLFQFRQDNLVSTKSIVARGQFAVSYMLGKLFWQEGAGRCAGGVQKSVKILYKWVDRNDHCRTFEALRRELNVLQFLGHHPCILNLVGASLENIHKQEIVMAFEYCANGSLLKLIRQSDPSADFEFDTVRQQIIKQTSIGGATLMLTKYQLVIWSCEVAQGMKYLAENNICHNDLAARNILVTSAWTTKICNFCLAQNLALSRSPSHQIPLEYLPLRWMAPEAIRQLAYSEKSDVWSFGVLLYELFSLGEIPYRGFIVDNQFWLQLGRAAQLTRPQYANARVWEVMRECLNLQAKSRPNFGNILDKLLSLRECHGRSQLEDYNRTFNMSKLCTA